MSEEREKPVTVPNAWDGVQDVLNEKAEINGQNRAWFEELLQALTVHGLVEGDDDS